MPFQIIRNDITKVKADAIVNTANPKPLIGRGTDGAIYAAAGKEQLLAERKKIGKIAPGQAFSTDAFNLSAKYIIHTVGPMWIDGSHGERDILRSCYESSMERAEELQCKSVAFPLIASGTNGFPKGDALNIALSEIGKFLLTHEMKVILVVFDRKALELSEQLVGSIDQYIDEHSTHLLREKEYGNNFASQTKRRKTEKLEPISELNHCFDEVSDYCDYYEANKDKVSDTSGKSDDETFEPDGIPDVTGKSLDEILGSAGETFQQRLLNLIDASGMDDVTVYKKANIDRKVFSRIRCKADYKPKKKTAVAFAVALELDLPTTLDLLSRAEIAFSPSNRFDLIVTYFITNRVYDIFEINAALFKYGQPSLGE